MNVKSQKEVEEKFHKPLKVSFVLPKDAHLDEGEIFFFEKGFWALINRYG